ncbi:MAG: FecR domain-containing protein [Elusimicrobia bacterium]|nr:FecR domain-containing protein [Elusimicrobiota bacterium]
MAAFSALPARAEASRSASIAGASGLVQVRGVNGERWVSVDKFPRALASGEAVRSGRQSSAFLRLAGEDTALLQEETVFTLEEARPERLLGRVEIGVAVFRFAVTKGRKAQIRTPAAALSSRGGEFRVSVLSGGRTTVDLAEGELGISDNRGHQLLLRAGESVRVDLRGLEVPRRLPAAAALRREGLRERIRREADGDGFRERLYASAAEGARRGEWEKGRALIDSSGRRLRAETWLLRPRPDQLELVTLTARPGRADYFYHLGTFDAALGGDTAAALRAMAGTAGAPPPRTLIAYEAVRSNGPDVMLETADGGHLVDLNANAVAADDVAAVFDPVTGTFSDASGRAAWRSLFDRYGLYLNGRLADGYSGANIQSSADAMAAASSANDPFSGAVLTAATALLDGGVLSAFTPSLTSPVPGSVSQLSSKVWVEGSNLSVTSSGLEGGRLRSGALPAVGGASAFRSLLLGTRLEQYIGSSLFGGRRIELNVDPALALSTGLVP